MTRDAESRPPARPALPRVLKIPHLVVKLVVAHLAGKRILCLRREIAPPALPQCRRRRRRRQLPRPLVVCDRLKGDQGRGAKQQHHNHPENDGHLADLALSRAAQAEVIAPAGLGVLAFALA